MDKINKSNQEKRLNQEASDQDSKQAVVIEDVSLVQASSTKTSSRVIRDVGEIQKIFDFYDADKSGFIEPHEFLPMLARLLRQPQSLMDKTEVWKQWDLVDADGSGQISFNEFMQWYCDTFSIEEPDFSEFFSEDMIPTAQRKIRELAKTLDVDMLLVEKIWDEFNKLDEDESGELDFKEFKVLMERLILPELQRGRGNPPTEIPPKVINKFWMDIDADSSGAVSLQEFTTWYLKFFMGGVSPMEHYYHTLGSGYRNRRGMQ